jgi:DNA-binding LytR/AlgR family response regulator
MNNKKDNGSAYYNEHVFVKIEWGHKRVCIHDIVYLEAQQNYCVIHLLKGNEKSQMMVTVPMREVLEDLNPDLFVRIHRSYAINIEHINVIAGQMVQMDNGKDINIGREYKNNLIDMFVFIGSQKQVKDNKVKAESQVDQGTVL